MQNLKIMETTRRKKTNASNNWSGWRFKRLMTNNNRFERVTLFSSLRLSRSLLTS